MKNITLTVVGALVFALVGCNKTSNSNPSDELAEQAKSTSVKKNQPIIYNSLELEDDGFIREAPKFAIWIRTEDENFPVHIFVNLDSNGVITSYAAFDWHSDKEFAIKVRRVRSVTQPTGISLIADYETEANILNLYADIYCVIGKGEIVCPYDNFPKTTDDLQKIIDSSPKNFAWQQIGKKLKPSFTVSQR